MNHINYTPGKCCKRQSIAVMDFQFRDERLNPIGLCIHRVCVHCFAHWKGPVGNVRAYTSKEWDAYLDECRRKDDETCRLWRESQNAA